MTQAERIDTLIAEGWSIYQYFPRWVVMSRRNAEETHYYFYGFGYEFITVFKNARTAKGFYRS